MPAPIHIYFLRREAYARIVAEVLRSPSRETGGILVGRTLMISEGPVLLVVAASGPGKRAVRRVDSYVPDVKSRQRELEYWRERYAAHNLDYVGEWHAHPAGVNELSSGDCYQVEQILTDTSYYLPDGIYTPIVTREIAGCVLHSWYCPRETARPQSVPWSVLEGEFDAGIATPS